MKPNGHTLNYKIEKTATSYIGQCIEIPTIIAQAKTKTELEKKMGVAINGYFEACPDASKTLSQTVGFAKVDIGKTS